MHPWRIPGDAHLDPQWNRALDLLTAAWKKAGPDVTIAALGRLVSDDAQAAGDVRGPGLTGATYLEGGMGGR